VHPLVLEERVHRALATDEQDPVVILDADGAKRLRFSISFMCAGELMKPRLIRS
jgi:hypothetical protein